VQPGDAVRALVTQRLVEPLAALFSIAEPVGRGVDGVLSQVKRLVTDLDGKLAQLVTGPDSLGGIKDTLEQLVQRLHAVDLGVVAQSLDALTAQVRGKLEALDPANLAAAVSAAFDEVLGALDLPQAIPVEDVQKLDDDYAAVVAKVKALDPKALVTDVVKPAYEQKVLPLLDAFDLTPLLQAIVDRLQALETDLGTQIDKVDAAFTQMRSAVPAAVAA
ncbi:MAG TPA: hypothetical protein VIU44_10910, partial [Gaiellaceae bacterium]